MNDIQRILVLSRTTKHCQKALHYGIQLAKNLGAELFVVHSIHNPFGLEGWNIPLPSLSGLKTEYKRIQEEAQRDLDAMIRRESAEGFPIEVMISEDEVVSNVLEIVKAKNIDLIVLRAHQESWLEHLLFGGSNETLVRKLPCSIMMIKDEPEAVDF